MNNIRKIITERLENAKCDYRKYPVLSTNDITLGNIQAYQDCLNLLPKPRTEQDILNDFEKLGYKIIQINEKIVFTDEYNRTIHINKIKKVYSYTTYIGMQEHKLLNELFEVWGWL